MRRKISVTIALVICLLVTLAALSACVTDDSSDAVVSIAVNNFPESAATVYQGDGLSLENCSIIVNYESGNRSVVDMDDEGVTVTGFSPNTVGTQTVTLTYRGKSVNVEVTVLAIQVTDVFISARPDEISVVEGGALDVTGVSLSIRYQNDKSVIMEKITTDMVTGYSTSLKAGEYVVYVNYYGFSLPLDIVVKSKTLTSVSVLSTPGKTSYFVGDAILLTGLELKLNYDNGTEGTVAWSEANKDDFIVEYDFSYANGRSNVAITYGGKYTSFIVSVVNPSCKSVEIITAPVTVGFASTGVQPSLLTHVVQGDKINWATGKARITYDNGYTEEIYMDDSAFYLYVNGTESANYIVDKTNYTFDVAGEVTAYIRYASNNFFTPISVSVFEKQAHTMFVADARPSADRINEKIFAQGTVLTTGYLKYNILYNNETWEFEYGDGSGSGWGQLTESMLSDGSVLTLRYNAATETGSGYSVQTISFTAGGKEASFLVKVAKPVAYRLDVSFPYKSVYLAGVDRELDLTGTSLYAELNTNEQVSYSLLTADFVSQYGRYYVMNGGEQGGETSNVFNTLGDYRLVIEYYGLEASFDFSVVGTSEYVGSIGVYDVITNAPIGLGAVVEQSDYSSLLAAYDVRGQLADGTSFDEPLSSDEVTLLAGLTSLTGKSQTFVFGYRGAYVTLGVTLTGRQITSVTVSSAPSKSVYAPGEAFDATGLRLVKVYDDGTQEQVSYPNAAISFGEIAPGTSGLYSLPIYYSAGGKSFTAYTDIIIDDSPLKGIAFDATQAGMSEFTDDKGEKYYALVVTLGQDLSVYRGDADGGVSMLTFTAILADSTEIEVPLRVEYIRYDRNVVASDENWVKDDNGERIYVLVEVPISYGGFTATITLYVSNRQLESIEIIQVPSKVDYAEGQQLDLVGGYLQRNYSNGESDVVPMTDGLLAVSGYIVSPFGSGSIIGGSYVQTVTVTYGTASTSFEVTTYRKIRLSTDGADRISLSGTSDEYGDSAEPVVGISASSIPGAVLPSTDVLYFVDGAWSESRPVYPGSYALKIIIFGNEYYEDLEIEYGTFNVTKRTLFIEIIDMSKVYGQSDPEFRYTIDDGVVLEGDLIQISLSRVAGENVGYYDIIAAMVAGANDNAFYELIADPGELTITQRVVTAMPDGTAIDVRFTPPQGFNDDTSTFVETGSRIGAFTASFVNESGVTEEIKSSDIKYYMYSDGGWVLLDNRPSAAGQYKVQISDNYSFRGTYSLSFVILSATG